jgi:hypothetical protein
MSKLLWSFLKVAPAIVGASFLVGIQSATAAPEAAKELQPAENLFAQSVPSDSSSTDLLGQPNQQRLDGQLNLDQGESMDQVTSVQELRDVEPTEWAYEALRSLVERYGCIVGYRAFDPRKRSSS